MSFPGSFVYEIRPKQSVEFIQYRLNIEFNLLRMQNFYQSQQKHELD